jgi:hypothetical protein
MRVDTGEEMAKPIWQSDEKAVYCPICCEPFLLFLRRKVKMNETNL